MTQPFLGLVSTIGLGNLREQQNKKSRSVRSNLKFVESWIAGTAQLPPATAQYGGSVEPSPACSVLEGTALGSPVRMENKAPERIQDNVTDTTATASICLLYAE